VSSNDTQCAEYIDQETYVNPLTPTVVLPYGYSYKASFLYFCDIRALSRSERQCPDVKKYK